MAEAVLSHRGGTYLLSNWALNNVTMCGMIGPAGVVSPGGVRSLSLIAEAGQGATSREVELGPLCLTPVKVWMDPPSRKPWLAAAGRQAKRFWRIIPNWLGPRVEVVARDTHSTTATFDEIRNTSAAPFSCSPTIPTNLYVLQHQRPFAQSIQCQANSLFPVPPTSITNDTSYLGRRIPISSRPAQGNARIPFIPSQSRPPEVNQGADTSDFTMGIHSIANACAHLQNASRARLGLTSIPNTKYNLRLALALHRAGFLSSVTQGGPHPPPMDQLSTYEPEPVTSKNVATRRIWVGLKYWNNEPVLKNLKAISKPSRLVTTKTADLNRATRGFPAGMVPGLNLGECLFLSTDRGVLEAREALEKKVGGLVLCRAS